MKRFAFSRQAEADLEEIGDYIARDNPARALSFIQEMREQCLQLVQAPSAHPARSELGKDSHPCAHGRYVIFFRIEDARIFIVRILRGARDLVRNIARRIVQLSST